MMLRRKTCPVSDVSRLIPTSAAPTEQYDRSTNSSHHTTSVQTAKPGKIQTPNNKSPPPWCERQQSAIDQNDDDDAVHMHETGAGGDG
ncbi:hypothetical protein Aduo_014647 [Ancylostoma duodenale]